MPETDPLEGAPAAMRPALTAYLSGGISAPVALMRLLLSGMTAEAVVTGLEVLSARTPSLAALAALARERRQGLLLLEGMAGAGAEHGAGASPEAAVAANRAMFDRLVRISPEASVAAYSLGDPELLDRATAELVSWLSGLGLLQGRPAVLDLGCGIGRLAAALAPHAGSVLGLDVSPGMIETARRRCGGVPNLRFETCSGHDLSGQPDAAFDLVLAADVFPYLVEAGLPLAERHVAEAARVLRPGGSLVILNFSYRDLGADRADLARMAAHAGFAILRNGVRELSIWDGQAFWLRRP